MQPKTFLLFILIFCGSGLAAQTISKNSNSPDSVLFDLEKLYIHTDKDAYIAGDTIWFKGYLTNSSYLSKIPLSNFIYVEFYCDTLISRFKIKCSDKGYAGYIPISKEIAPGNYAIRSYTRNMQNYPSEFVFQKNIVVLKRNTTPVSKVTGKTKEIGYDIDVQFLPESGRYIKNRPAKIAFKAIGSDGRSANISVTLYNNAGTPVGQYESRHNGMGLINLINTDAEGYYAIVAGNDGFTKKVLLPGPDTSGATIGVTRIGEKIGFTTYVTNDINGAFIVIRNGSEELIKKPLTGNLSSTGIEEKLILSESSLPEGVNSAQIVNGTGEILAERLFFINRFSRPQIEVLQGKKKYEKQEKVELMISLKDISGKPLAGEFSLAVTDSSIAPVIFGKDNILTYLELSSELRGEVEDPEYYFNNPTAETEKYLDIVMLTHGWRYHTLSSGFFKREYTQEISGSVSGLFKRQPKNTTLMILAPSIKFQQAFFLQKSNTFLMEGLDFPDSTKFLLGVAGKAGGQLFGLMVNNEKFFPITPLGGIYYKPEENEKIQKAADILRIIKPEEKTIQLKPVVIEARRQIFQPKFNPSPFLQSFSRSQMKEREDLKEYDDFFLIDYIYRTFPGLTIGTGDASARTLFSTRPSGMTGGRVQPLLYLDGMQTDLSYIDMYGMMVSDVENVGFLRGNAGSMFQTLNGVILISTRRGKSLFNKASSNVVKISPLGYQKSVEFYSPKYETSADKKLAKTDLRSTLYWNPCIRTDQNGCAKVIFYTGDLSPKLNFSVEGITGNGDYIVFAK